VKFLWVRWRIIIPFWGVSCALADSCVCIVQLPNQKKFRDIPEPRKGEKKTQGVAKIINGFDHLSNLKICNCLNSYRIFRALNSNFFAAGCYWELPFITS
jgi:hypothetical protein